MSTLNLAPHQLRKGDRVPEFDGTVTRVADRRETSASGVVEVWFNDDHAPLGFLPAFPMTLTVERH